METYAVVETSGKQYRLTAGATLTVDRMDAEPGATVELRPVLAVSDGTKLIVGTPEVTAAKVAAQVVEHRRGPKIVAYKKHRRKGYARKRGHRQELTILRIATIESGAAAAPA